jgi:hypothetical protein
MIEDAKEERLERIGEAIAAETEYELLQAQPKLERTITEKINEPDDTLGFLVLRGPVLLKGLEYEGDVIVTVHEDHLSNRGVDVTSHPDDPIPKEKRERLDTLVPGRDVTDEDGETRRVWSYFPPPADLPPGVVDESRDNLDDLLEEFEAIYERVSED